MPRSAPLALVLACVALAACSEHDVPADAASPHDAPPVDAADIDDAAALDASTRDDGGMVARPPSCFDGAVTSTPTADGFVVRTPHYELHAQLELARAEELARMLEAALSEYQAFFGAERVATMRVVKIFRDEAAFEAGLVADGLPMVDEAGGYYEPSNDTAYLYVQPTRYYTDVLTLHEAAHQLHHRSASASGFPFWYVEGIAEMLGRHDWDGRCVRLGVRPLLSQEDLSDDALSELTATGATLASIVETAPTTSRPLACEVLRYFGREGAPDEAAFRAFRLAVDGGADLTSTLHAMLGDLAERDADFAAFVAADQEPMAVVYLEWTHLDSTSLRGSSPGAFSIARVKTELSHFEVTFTPPATAGWSAGVLTGWTDVSHWHALVVREGGRLARFEVDGSATWWDEPTTVAPDASGAYHVSVELAPGTVHVEVNGTAFDRTTTLGAVSGPAVDSSEVRFTNIAWR